MTSAFGGRGPMVLAVTWSLASLSIVLCLLRLYGASVKAGRLRWDFFWIILGLLFSLGAEIAVTTSVVHGMGNHIGELQLDDIVEVLHGTFIGACMGAGGVTFAKWAIIALIMEVQGPSAKKRNWFLYFLGAMILIVSAVSVVMVVTACEPVSQQWNIVGNGACPRREASFNMSYAQGAMSIISDLILAIWPVSIVWNLQTSMRVKAGFCVLMAVGAFTAVASLIRCLLTPGILATIDFTYVAGVWIIWANTESWLVIILGSIPPLRPLFLRWTAKVSSTVQSKMGSRYGANTPMNATAKSGTNPGSLQMRSLNAAERGEKESPTSNSLFKTYGKGDTEEKLTPPMEGAEFDAHNNGIFVQHEFNVEEGRWASMESSVRPGQAL